MVGGERTAGAAARGSVASPPFVGGDAIGELQERAEHVESTAAVVSGRTDFPRVERDFLNEEAGRFFLPVTVLHHDLTKSVALAELPQEGARGANRIWINLANRQESTPVIE
jgi:hypothetical protein